MGDRRCWLPNQAVLAELERQANVTLPSLGLITEQTIAGAISTGTHGSGKASMSHYIEEIRLATYDKRTGEPVVKTIADGDELRARPLLARLPGRDPLR